MPSEAPVPTVSTEPSDSTPAVATPTPAEQESTTAPIASTSSLPPTDGEPVTETPMLSKNAAKKLAKRLAFEAQRGEKRARERAMRKEKAAEKRKLVELGVIEAPVNKKLAKQRPKTPFNARIVLDLGFDELMNERDIKSMSQQLSYSYNANRMTAAPVPLLATSLGGKLKAKLDANQGVYKSWKGIEWWEQGYEQLWSEEEGVVELGVKQGQPQSRSKKEDVTYLTGDSPNVLEKFEEGKTYVLGEFGLLFLPEDYVLTWVTWIPGGIVDHNQHKFICYNKANAQGIKHAQLPIAKYMPEMLARKILTVNQVVDIITKWTELRDWTAALSAAMPTRKFHGESRKERRKKNAAGDAQSGGEEGKGEAADEKEGQGEGRSSAHEVAEVQNEAGEKPADSSEHVVLQDESGVKETSAEETVKNN
ncbi:tRNA (guanine-N1-)-methyltransferase [Pseudohyphozyma bogoriensis]|nr:tRNA (guanine-N1-)-methyltransferase [Pseudohyphozyma bogoriensis]